MLNDLDTSPNPAPTLAPHTSGDKSVSVFVVSCSMALNQSEIQIRANMFIVFGECWRRKIRKKKNFHIFYMKILHYIHFSVQSKVWINCICELAVAHTEIYGLSYNNVSITLIIDAVQFKSNCLCIRLESNINNWLFTPCITTVQIRYVSPVALFFIWNICVSFCGNDVVLVCSVVLQYNSSNAALIEAATEM